MDKSKAVDVEISQVSPNLTPRDEESAEIFHFKESVESKDANTGEPSPKPLSFWLSFLSLNLTVFIVSLDATALAVAIPRITYNLKGTTLEAFWANLSFVLAVVVSQPIYTTTSDVLGRKSPLYAAFALFFIGSIAFGVAHSMQVLILGRILQGLGGGGLDVLTEIILADLTSLKERPLYLGLYAIPMAGGGVCGPLIGAALSEYVGWRWIGFINLPIVAVSVILVFFFLRLRPVPGSAAEGLAKLDWVGITLFTIGSTTFALPLSWAGAMYPWGSWRTVVPFVTGACILICFGIYERRPMEPVFPYRLFKNRTSLATLIGSAIQGAVLYSVLFYTPLFFQAVMLETPFRSALSVLPGCVYVVAFSAIGVVTVEITRRYRIGIIMSWILLACGVGLFALWRPSSSRALLYGIQIAGTVGIGTLFTMLVIPMTASVKNANDMGIATGVLVSFRLFGALVGLAVCSSVFSNVFEERIASIGQLPPPLDKLNDSREAIGFIPIFRTLDIDSILRYQIVDAYRVSMMAIYLTLAGLGLIGLITSLFTKELSIERDELGRQRLE